MKNFKLFIMVKLQETGLSLREFFGYNMYVEITFSAHARHRMEERAITEIEVHLGLEAPQKVGTEGDTDVAMRLRSNGHLLIVIYRKNGNSYHVITVIHSCPVRKLIFEPDFGHR